MSIKKKDKAIKNNVKTSLVPFACTFEKVKCMGKKQFSALCAVAFKITFGKTQQQQFHRYTLNISSCRNKFQCLCNLGELTLIAGHARVWK